MEYHFFLGNRVRKWRRERHIYVIIREICNYWARLEETNRIINEKYRCLVEEMKEKHKIKGKIYEDYYSGITMMNDRSTHVVLEFNVK